MIDRDCHNSHAWCHAFQSSEKQEPSRIPVVKAVSACFRHQWVGLCMLIEGIYPYEAPRLEIADLWAALLGVTGVRWSRPDAFDGKRLKNVFFPKWFSMISTLFETKLMPLPCRVVPWRIQQPSTNIISHPSSTKPRSWPSSPAIRTTVATNSNIWQAASWIPPTSGASEDDEWCVSRRIGVGRLMNVLRSRSAN